MMRQIKYCKEIGKLIVLLQLLEYNHYTLSLIYIIYFTDYHFSFLYKLLLQKLEYQKELFIKATFTSINISFLLNTLRQKKQTEHAKTFA